MILGLGKAFGSAAQAVVGWSVTSLVEALQVNDPATITITLNCNATFSSDDWVAVANALASNTSCREIRLGAAGIKDREGVALAQALKHNSTLLSMRMSGNPVGDVTALAMAEMLQVNGTLVRLSLAENRITDVGAKAIAACLRINRTLQILYLNDTYITDDGVRDLQSAASSNEILQQLEVGAKVGGSPIWAALIGGGRRFTSAHAEAELQSAVTAKPKEAQRSDEARQMHAATEWSGVSVETQRAKAEAQAQSERLGIQLKWVLENFPADVESTVKDFPAEFSALSGKAVMDLNFTEIAPIKSYGRRSYGKGRLCPRDGKMDCSIVDGVFEEGFSALATIFLSWVWMFPLRVVLDALREFMYSHSGDADFSTSSCYIWWCFFQNNQHRILGDNKQISFDELAHIFGTRLKGVGRMMCMMDKIENSLYTGRAWCDFEVFVGSKEGIAMEVILPSTCRAELDALFKRYGLDLKRAITVDVEKAKATSKQDEENIKQLIQTQSSFHAVNEAVQKSLVKCIAQQVIRAQGY